MALEYNNNFTSHNSLVHVGKGFAYRPTPPVAILVWSHSAVNRRKSISIWFPLRRSVLRASSRFESRGCSSSSSSIVGHSLSTCQKVIWNREMESSSTNNLITTNHLRHVESMATMPSGAGKIPHLNAIILGEALASEENDLIFPSDDFSRQAHVPSPQKATPLCLFVCLFVVFCTRRYI